MKHFLLLAVSAVMLAVVGWNLYQRAETKIARDSRVQANIDAITSVEKDTDSDITTPPDPWNYMPNAKLIVSLQQYKLTCLVDGQLNIGGISIVGEFQSGISYRVIVEVYKCKPSSHGEWCNPQKEIANIVGSSPE